MRRRRLVLVGLVALTALGLYVRWANRLTKEERQILGTWYHRSLHGLTRFDFFPDRTHRVCKIDERTGAVLSPTAESLQLSRLEWRARDGKLIETLNLGFVARVRGALPAGFPGALALELDALNSCTVQRQ